jgi:hypothetical protein
MLRLPTSLRWLSRLSLLIALAGLTALPAGAALPSAQVEPAAPAPPAADAPPPKPAAPAAPLPPADTWIPREAVIVLKMSNPDAILDQLLSPALIDAVQSHPAFRAATANPGVKQVMTLLRTIEGRLQADWKAILRRFLGGGATAAVGPGGAVLLVVDARDPEVLQVLHEFLLFFVRMAAAGKGQLDPVRPTEVGDVSVWSLGPQEAHAIVGRRLLVTNRPEVLKAVLALRDGTGGEGLAGVPAWRESLKAAGPDAAAALYVDTAAIKKLPQIAKALEADREPLAALLAAPLLESLGRSSWLALALKVGDGELVLDAISDGTIPEKGASRFARPPKAGPGTRPNLAVPRRIAAMTLYRDLHGFYAAKDDLFPERTSGLIFFENMMGIFFTGRNLTEEVFAELGPEIRLVVAEQAVDPAVGTPAVRYPAFAFVAPLKNPGRYKRVMEEAWQKAIGLVNFTRGQQAEPGLVIDRPVHAGTKYTVAGFNPVEGDDKSAVDARFNFEPALAMPGDWLILSSTGALARDLMDALARETGPAAGAPPAGTHSLFEIDGPQLASILESNREALVRNNMVEEGKTREEAATGVELMMTVARVVRGVSLSLGADEGRSTASLRIRLGRPVIESGGR